MQLLEKQWPLILLFLAWLPFAATLRYVPSEEGARDFSNAMLSLARETENAPWMNEKERQEHANNGVLVSDWQGLLGEWRVRWGARVVVFVLGLASIVLTVLRTKGWKIGLLVASASYLLLAHGISSGLLQGQRWQAWWAAATRHPDWFISVFYVEILFPLFHAFLIGALLVNLSIEFAKRPVGRKG